MNGDLSGTLKGWQLDLATFSASESWRDLLLVEKKIKNDCKHALKLESFEIISVLQSGLGQHGEVMLPS